MGFKELVLDYEIIAEKSRYRVEEANFIPDLAKKLRLDHYNMAIKTKTAI